MNLLTTKDIAKHFNVEPVTAKRWAQLGLFPNAYKQGRDWAIPESDLLMFKRPKMGYPKGRPRKYSPAPIR